MISFSKLLALLLCYHAAALWPEFDPKTLDGDHGEPLDHSRRSMRYFRSTDHGQNNSPDYIQSYSLPMSQDTGKQQQNKLVVPISHTKLLVGVLIGLTISVVLCACCKGEYLISLGVGIMIAGIILAFYLTHATSTLRSAFLALLGCCVAGSAWIGIGQHKIYLEAQAEVEERRWIKRTAMKLSKKEWQGYELVISEKNRVPLRNRGDDESETEFLASNHHDSFDATATL